MLVMNLKNTSALVTGGSDGLGLSIAKALVIKGAQTHIVSRSQTNLDKAAEAINSPLLHTHQGDVTDYQAMEVLVKEIGDIDILINNAGVWLEGQVVEQTREEIDHTIDINLKGVVYTTKIVLPQMLKRNSGFIINVSSTSGLRGREDQAIYVASKFGVTGFTKSLEKDLIDTEVKIAGFYPGGMNTGLFAKTGHPRKNEAWMDTDEVAEIVIFMLDHDQTMLVDHVVVVKRKT
jgi:NADP-dependent 3-hydroxy acid dehydrogenase YdfG